MAAGLAEGQSAVTLLTLYECTIATGISSIKAHNGIHASIHGGTADIYGITSATQPTALSEMDLNAENTGVSGIIPFGIVPKYIAVKENTPTPVVVFSGINLKAVGTVS